MISLQDHEMRNFLSITQPVGHFHDGNNGEDWWLSVILYQLVAKCDFEQQSPYSLKRSN